MTAAQAAALIRDGDTVGLMGGGGGLMEATHTFEAIQARFLETQHPRNLTVMHALGIGDKKTKGMNCFAHEGMVKRVMGGHWVWSPAMQQLALNEKIEAYILPGGVSSQLMREIGAGRPGWHIECCAIALHYLQPDEDEEFSIDIQGGGSDLIFPHHEMSAAQSRLINGRRFSRSYVHAGMIGLDGEKMSKSLGNLVFVSKLIAQGVEPMAIRWALLSNSYSKDRMWSDEILSAAKEDIERLRLALSKSEVAPTDQVITEIISALSDDLDTPSALHILRNWCERTISGETGGSAGELSRSIDALLGIAL